MKVKEYFKVVGINELLTELMFLYPGQINSRQGYSEMFNTINNLESIPTDMKVSISHVKYEDEDYINVSGVKSKEEDPECHNWAIEHNPWGEWLSMDVLLKTTDIRCCTPAKVLAHIMWEMSWAGFTQEDIKEQMAEILESKADLDYILANNTTEEAIEKGLLIELNLDDIQKSLDL